MSRQQTTKQGNEEPPGHAGSFPASKCLHSLETSAMIHSRSDGGSALQKGNGSLAAQGS